MRALPYICFAILSVAIGCESKSGSTAPAAADDRLTVVATTTMLEDMVRQVGGDHVNVIGIMQPGGDPHLYQPRPSDARAVAEADIIVTNGLHLEGWIDDLVENAGGKKKTFIVAGKVVEPIRSADSPGGVDPHFWFDTRAWANSAAHVGTSIAGRVDASRQGDVKASTKAYVARLNSLHVWVSEQLKSVPDDRRVLVTSHDAFNYFGEAYGIDVVGIQGISTEQEASQRDVANTIDLVKERGAPAVFVETSVNPRLIEQVARGANVKVAGPLYSDSVGPTDSPAATYVGMVTENVRMIVEALGGTYVAFGVEPADQGA
jgi:ABC-type Zn uptake system ZnuABC Zn-binding protein ZnuA